METCNRWNSPDEISASPSGSVSSNYSLISGGGYGSILNTDPLFVDPSNGDYSLQAGSPCIDTGNPSSQYNDTDGSRNNMGAYGVPSGN